MAIIDPIDGRRAYARPRAWRKRILVGLLFLTAIPSSARASSLVSLQTWVSTAWQTRDGLPQQTVNALTQSHDGYIWVGTQDGLGRFDGQRFAEYDTANTPGLATDEVDVLTEDGQGSLWIAGEAGVSVTQGGGSIVNATPKDVPWIRAPIDYRMDPHRNFWLRAGGRFYKGDHGALRVACVDPDGPLRPNNGEPDAWTVDSDGSVWLADSSNGVEQLGSTGTVRFALETHARIVAMAADNDGGVWIASTAGISEIKDSVVHTVGDGPNYSSIVADSRGDVWTLADGQLYRVVDDALMPIDDWSGVRVDSISINSVGDLLCQYGGASPKVGVCVNRTFVCPGVTQGTLLCCIRDTQGDIWMGTDTDLECIRDRACKTLGAAAGLGPSRITSAMVDLGWRVLVAEEDGSLYRYVSDSDPRFELILRSPRPIRSLVETADGVYLCIVDGVVDQIDGMALKKYAPASGGQFGAATSLGIGEEGDLWIAGSNGIANIAHGAVKFYPLPAGAAALATYVDHEDRFWASTDGALYCVDHDALRVYRQADGIPGAPVDAIVEDSDNNLWLGSRGEGLTRYANGRFQTITRRDGLPSNIISQIFEDDAGNLWLGSPKEIFRIDVKGLRNFLDHGMPFRAYSYGPADGNSGGSCLMGAQLSGLHGWVSCVWFPCRFGMVRVEPWETPTGACPIALEDITVDGRRVSTSTSPTLQPGDGNASIRFTALDLRDPEHLQFSYRLVGLSNDWIDAGQLREAFYTNLPPGTYRFDLRCVNVDGGWSATRSFQFTILPHLYQMLWFRLLSILVIAGYGFLIVRNRIRGLQERNRVLQGLHAQLEAQNDRLFASQGELEAQNEELSDLQAELEAQNAELVESKSTLEQVNLKLQALATTDGLTNLMNHRTFQEELQIEWNRCCDFGQPVSLLLIDVDHFKGFNDEFGHQAGDQVLMEVGDVLRSTVRKDDLAARYGGEEFAVILRHTSAAEAATVGERFRVAIERNIRYGDRQVTASIGVSTASPRDIESSPAELIESADIALYTSKHRGRNCVTHIDDSGPSLTSQAA